MTHRSRQLFILTLLVATVLVPLAITSPAAAQSDRRCFPETGWCISGEIREYWENNGGLPVFGYPITDMGQQTIEDWTGPVQWFERDRLEDHTVQGQGVLAGRLGADLLELRQTPWETFEKVSEAAPGCAFFPETGHSLCEPFLSYWNNNGSLVRFGYPITEPIQETIGNWTGTVQYFERRRMEHHTENAGTRFEVQLGLLGREAFFFEEDEEEEDPLANCTTPVFSEALPRYESLSDDSRNSMGCPGQVYANIPAALQAMEDGQMIWFELNANDRRIIAYVDSYYSYSIYPDTWEEGVDPDVPNVAPPEGLFAPRGGFGKVWINNSRLREIIGWAIEEAPRAEQATVQLFDNGGIIVWLQSGDNLFIGFGGDNDSFRFGSRQS